MPQKSSKVNQNGKKYLEYSEMSKEDLIAMLRRVHARIKRVSASLREMENEVEALRQLLLYGSSNSSSGSGYTRGKSYGGKAGYRTGGYGKYRRAGKKPAQVREEEEEPVEVGEEVEEEEPKPSEEKPAEKPAKPEKGGS